MATSSARSRRTGRSPGPRSTSLFAGLLTAVVMAMSGCTPAGQVQLPVSGPSETMPSGTMPSGTTPSGTTPFAWFVAGPVPAGWTTMELPDGTAVLAIPPEATPLQGDPGSVSAGVAAPDGDLLVYLNATPGQGEESLANWPRFRLDHLTGEHAASATMLSARTGMAFRGGSGSCVDDSYVTSVGAHRYREIACFVTGTKGSSVLVAAAIADGWDLYRPLLEQAVDSYLGE